VDQIDEAYAVLGLLPGASQTAVKEAYRDLAKVWHPDRFPHDPRIQAKAQEELKKINAAYELLSSIQPRPKDRSRPRESAQSQPPRRGRSPEAGSTQSPPPRNRSHPLSEKQARGGGTRALNGAFVGFWVGIPVLTVSGILGGVVSRTFGTPETTIGYFMFGSWALSIMLGAVIGYRRERR
jgi:curved DNA-binding protein CbpA